MPPAMLVCPARLLLADMPFSTRVPSGHGHASSSEQAAAWAEIAPPSGWTRGRTVRLWQLIG